MFIKLKLLTGKIINVNVDEKETIHQVKLKIQDMEGIQPEHQKILFNGRLLLDQSCIKDTLIETDSTLNMVLSLRGGSKDFDSLSNETNYSADFPIVPVILSDDSTGLLANTNDPDTLYEIRFSHSTIDDSHQNNEKKPYNKFCCSII